MTGDEMVGWHHRLNGQFEKAQGGGDGQGSLACCSPWGRKESDTTERLHFTNGFLKLIKIFYCCDYVTIIHLIPLYHDESTEK